MINMVDAINNQPVLNWWFRPDTGTPDVKGFVNCDAGPLGTQFLPGMGTFEMKALSGTIQVLMEIWKL